ncbi:MAG TPA: cobyric acid synthase [Mycobacteriales bacterium]|nr:cobyric acid synthase [Mycobacteriales bacterium]
MSGALLVAGTTSDAGKSVVTAGLCRWLSRQGVRVAPFKAQNMSLNSFVTLDGGEIGRAQAMQAAAAGVEPRAAMNPVLLKPGGERHSQVVVLGQPVAEVDAMSYRNLKPALLEIVLEALSELRRLYDVVICEGAGSPAEINLRDRDIANMGLARAADLPVLVVGDIDRGGLFAALYGTLALLEPADQRLVAGFVVNKFRGDPALLAPGVDMLTALTGRPTLGVLPWRGGLWLDVEDSLDLDSRQTEQAPPIDRDVLRVAVVRLPRMSNFTDVDALAVEPGVSVRFVTSPAEVADADLVVLPGSRATVSDLRWLHDRGLAVAITARAERGRPVLGICGGYQILGEQIVDHIESGAGTVAGLTLLPARTVFAADKTLARPVGTAPGYDDAPVTGYEIRHGRTTAYGGDPMFQTAGEAEGCRLDAVWGTSWHGVLESDGFRRALLADVAARTGRHWVAGTGRFADVRQARLDALGDLVADHLDTGAVWRLLTDGPPTDLPVLSGAPAVPAGAAT